MCRRRLGERGFLQLLWSSHFLLACLLASSFDLAFKAIPTDDFVKSIASATISTEGLRARCKRNMGSAPGWVLRLMRLLLDCEVFPISPSNATLE